MSATATASDYQARARAAKAYKLARILVRAVRDHGADPASFRVANDEAKEQCRRLAGVRPPSDPACTEPVSPETWALACAIADDLLAAG